MSGYLHVEHQLGFSSSKTIRAKQNFEKLALDHGVIAGSYHADNGVFKANAFVWHIREHNKNSPTVESMPIIKMLSPSEPFVQFLNQLVPYYYMPPSTGNMASIACFGLLLLLMLLTCTITFPLPRALLLLTSLPDNRSLVISFSIAIPGAVQSMFWIPPWSMAGSSLVKSLVPDMVYSLVSADIIPVMYLLSSTWKLAASHRSTMWCLMTLSVWYYLLLWMTLRLISGLLSISQLISLTPRFILSLWIPPVLSRMTLLS